MSYMSLETGDLLRVRACIQQTRHNCRALLGILYPHCEMKGSCFLYTILGVDVAVLVFEDMLHDFKEGIRGTATYERYEIGHARPIW